VPGAAGNSFLRRAGNPAYAYVRAALRCARPERICRLRRVIETAAIFALTGLRRSILSILKCSASPGGPGSGLSQGLPCPHSAIAHRPGGHLPEVLFNSPDLLPMIRKYAESLLLPAPCKNQACSERFFPSTSASALSASIPHVCWRQFLRWATAMARRAFRCHQLPRGRNQKAFRPGTIASMRI